MRKWNRISPILRHDNTNIITTTIVLLPYSQKDDETLYTFIRCLIEISNQILFKLLFSIRETLASWNFEYFIFKGKQIISSIYQTVHLWLGFIWVPFLHCQASWNSSEFESAPITRNLAGEWGSSRIWSLLAEMFKIFFFEYLSLCLFVPLLWNFFYYNHLPTILLYTFLRFKKPGQ